MSEPEPKSAAPARFSEVMRSGTLGIGPDKGASAVREWRQHSTVTGQSRPGQERLRGHHDQVALSNPEDAGSTDRASAIARLSTVVPVFNEQDVLAAFFARLIPSLEQTSMPFEVICIDDGSRDESLAVLLRLRERHPEIKVIALTRNFGKELAITAGLDCARGAVVAILDADMQHPPEVIPELVERWRDGYDVVYGVRRLRRDQTRTKRFVTRRFYGILGRLSDVAIPGDAGDFRVLDRAVVDALGDLPERVRFMKGLYAWVGYRQTGVEYDSPPRAAGASKWSYWSLWNFAIRGIVSFSSVPLRVWSYVGGMIATLAFLYGCYVILKTLILGIDEPGFASMIIAVFFFGGLQLLTLGIIGEYIAAIFLEVKARPLYLVQAYHGFGEEPPADRHGPH